MYIRYKEEISLQDQERIAVLYGTSDLHTARDDNSFTKELYKVIKDNDWAYPILRITG